MTTNQIQAFKTVGFSALISLLTLWVLRSISDTASTASALIVFFGTLQWAYFIEIKRVLKKRP